MWKSSHLTVASRISDYYRLGKYQSLFLKIGSIIPDLKPTCYYKRHIRNNWENYTSRLLNRSVNRKKSLLFYYDFGKLLHFYCDFYTRPHTCNSLSGFLSNHVAWERNLNSLIKRYFSLEVHIPLEEIKRKYISENKLRVNIDLKYIQSICFYLCEEVGLSSV